MGLRIMGGGGLVSFQVLFFFSFWSSVAHGGLVSHVGQLIICMLAVSTIRHEHLHWSYSLLSYS